MAKVVEGVRKFIVQHKELIKDGYWYELFNDWRREYWHSVILDDSFQVNNFFEVLEEAGYTNIRKDTEGVRTTLIIEQLLEAFENYMSEHYNFVDELVIEYSDLISEIKSYLGFSIPEIVEIIETSNLIGTICNEHNATLDSVLDRIIVR